VQGQTGQGRQLQEGQRRRARAPALHLRLLKTRTNAGMLSSVLPPTFANSEHGAPSVEILRAESWATWQIIVD
jgi:hypothetical protein